MSKPFSDTPTAALLALRPAPWRYERAKGEQPTAWQGRPVFNVYDAEGYWIGRVADETEPRAEAAARVVALSPVLLAALREVAAAETAGWQAAMNGNAGAQLAAADRMAVAMRQARAVLAAVDGEG